MDNKVLDEAVEVLVTRLDLNPDYFGAEEIRESFLAGVKVLLGEVVATLCHDHDEGWWIDWEGRLPESTESIEVYAPSLGEGDGR